MAAASVGARLDPYAAVAGSHQRVKKECCSVCLEHDKLDTTLLPCRHSFHSECILGWVQNHNSCPLCRAPVTLYIPKAPFTSLDERFVAVWEKYYNSRAEAIPTHTTNKKDAKIHKGNPWYRTALVLAHAAASRMVSLDKSLLVVPSLSCFIPTQTVARHTLFQWPMSIKVHRRHAIPPAFSSFLFCFQNGLLAGVSAALLGGSSRRHVFRHALVPATFFACYEAIKPSVPDAVAAGIAGSMANMYTGAVVPLFFCRYAVQFGLFEHAKQFCNTPDTLHILGSAACGGIGSAIVLHMYERRRLRYLVKTVARVAPGCALTALSYDLITKRRT